MNQLESNLEDHFENHCGNQCESCGQVTNKFSKFMDYQQFESARDPSKKYKIYWNNPNMPVLERYCCYNTSYVNESDYLCFERDNSAGFKERVTFFPPDNHNNIHVTFSQNAVFAHYDDWIPYDHDTVKKIN